MNWKRRNHVTSYKSYDSAGRLKAEINSANWEDKEFVLIIHIEKDDTYLGTYKSLRLAKTAAEKFFEDPTISV